MSAPVRHFLDIGELDAGTLRAILDQDYARILPLGLNVGSLPRLDDFGRGKEQDQKAQHGAPDRHALSNPRVERSGKHRLNRILVANAVQPYKRYG